MIRAITQRSADVDLTHRLARETATWDDLEGCGTEHPTVEAAREHLAANGGGWLWFADDDPESEVATALRAAAREGRTDLPLDGGGADADMAGVLWTDISGVVWLGVGTPWTNKFGQTDPCSWVRVPLQALPLRIRHVGPDHDNPGNWPDDEGLWP